MQERHAELSSLNEDIPVRERRFFRLADDVALRIIQLMQARGLNQEQLSQLLGKHKSYVSRVLGGGVNLTLRTVAEFEEALGDRIVQVMVEQGASRRRSSSAKTVRESGTKPDA